MSSSFEKTVYLGTGIFNAYVESKVEDEETLIVPIAPIFLCGSYLKISD